MIEVARHFSHTKFICSCWYHILVLHIIKPQVCSITAREALHNQFQPVFFCPL